MADISQIIGVLTAALTLIALVFGKRSITYLGNWVQGIWQGIIYPFNGTHRRLTSMSQDHQRLSEKLDFIVEQLKPNSGSSLRDAINRLEKNQQISEVKMAHYLDTKETAMFETDKEGLFVWISHGYESLTGRPINDLKNWGWTLAIDPQDLENTRLEWNLAIEQKRTFEYSYRVRHVSGTSTLCYCRAVPTLFNNEIIAWVGVISPVK